MPGVDAGLHAPPEEVVEELFTDTHEHVVQRREMRQLLAQLHLAGHIFYANETGVSEKAKARLLAAANTNCFCGQHLGLAPDDCDCVKRRLPCWPCIIRDALSKESNP